MTQLRNDNRKFAYHVVGEICRSTGQEARGSLLPDLELPDDGKTLSDTVIRMRGEERN